MNDPFTGLVEVNKRVSLDKTTVTVDPGYPFTFTDGGRSMSARPRQKYDCTVIALAIATGKPYDQCYAECAAGGRKPSRSFDFEEFIQHNPVLLGHHITRLSFPAVKGQRRMHTSTFCERYNDGAFIARVAKHVFAVLDGVVYDEEPPRENACIYVAYRFDPLG